MKISKRMLKYARENYNEVKHTTLNPEGPGVVSEECAVQMAEGARNALGASMAVSVTGIAGPGGAEPGKPVGTVWMAVSTADGTKACCFEFSGDRDDVRNQTVDSALKALLDAIE